MPLIYKSEFMKQELTVNQQKQSVQVNRYGYILYLILVGYLFIQGDIEWATINMGIALVFDPFDASVKWNDRPLYQKLWLIVHLAITFAGFIYLALR